MAPGRPCRFKAFLRNFKAADFIAFLRDEGFEDLAPVINRAPQVVTLAVDPAEHLVEVPAPVTKPQHARDTFPSDISCKQRPKPVPPQPYRLVANVEPRSNSRSSTLRRDNGNRTYVITTNRITSGDDLKYRKGSDLSFDRQLIPPTYRPSPGGFICFDSTSKAPPIRCACSEQSRYEI
jgi:hypothetical protein